ncbi:MAG TPA: tetratricopeptide repeat protein [Candidatus Eremiobacteraceae bacterium]|nr:tetratricopeptide repeat protein [Candidatus Eremiobacteraceae bacterium]
MFVRTNWEAASYSSPGQAMLALLRRIHIEGALPLIAVITLIAALTASPAPSPSAPAPAMSSPRPNADAQPEFILAEAELKAGNNEAAIHDFDQAIQLDPTFMASYLDRGNAEVRAGRLDDAIIDFSRVIKADPNNATAYSDRGASYGQLGENALALADLRRAQALDPKDAGNDYNLASVEAQSGDLKSALSDMDRSIATAPSAFSYRGRAQIESALGDQTGAIRDMTSAIKVDAADPGLRAGRGLYYQRAHRYAAAVADFGAAIRLAPAVPQFRMMRAQTRVLAKDIPGAVADLRELRRMMVAANNKDAVNKLDQAINVLLAPSHAAATPKPHATPHPSKNV